jgi:cysteinyl-tRNA synthetase
MRWSRYLSINILKIKYSFKVPVFSLRMEEVCLESFFMSSFLRLHNSLSRTKETFIPWDPSHVKLYVCGPTVYDRIHLGNARPIVIFDTLVRVLQRLFPKVTYVRNITDVDDKINTQAHKRGISIDVLTQETTRYFHDDIQELGAMPPTVEPRATGHIQEMIDMIQILVDAELAYVGDDHVLFDVAQDADYGKLSGVSLEHMIAGARVEVAPYKKNPQDFVLWKPSKENEPAWPSPWGVGRPGWHIECSAMSACYLGKTFDIHGGGGDLLFPHHENERAQSRGALCIGESVKYWVHNGMLLIDGEKMSKSLGNFITLREVLDQMPGDVVRWALLSTHYRQTLDWTASLVHQAKVCVNALYQILEETALTLDQESASQCDQKPEEDEVFLSFLLDDLNTPGALNHLYHLISQALQKPDPNTKSKILHNCQVLGLGATRSKTWATALVPGAQDIENLIEQRRIARQASEYSQADIIRKDLENQGISLEDYPGRTVWRRKFF